MQIRFGNLLHIIVGIVITMLLAKFIREHFIIGYLSSYIIEHTKRILNTFNRNTVDP